MAANISSQRLRHTFLLGLISWPPHHLRPVYSLPCIDWTPGLGAQKALGNTARAQTDNRPAPLSTHIPVGPMALDGSLSPVFVTIMTALLLPEPPPFPVVI